MSPVPEAVFAIPLAELFVSMAVSHVAIIHSLIYNAEYTSIP